MRVSERCRHVLITTVPEETLLGVATRMDWYRVGALPVYRPTGWSASSPSAT